MNITQNDRGGILAFSKGAGGIFLTMGKGFGNRTEKIGKSFFPSLPSTLVSLEGLATSLYQLGKEGMPAYHSLPVRVTGRNDKEVISSLFRCYIFLNVKTKPT